MLRAIYITMIIFMCLLCALFLKIDKRLEKIEEYIAKASTREEENSISIFEWCETEEHEQM